MNIAIVDRDLCWVKKIKNKISCISDKNKISCDIYDSSVEFMERIRKYHILLINIRMEHIDGLVIARMYHEMYSDSQCIVLLDNIQCSDKKFVMDDVFVFVEKSYFEENLKEFLKKGSLYENSDFFRTKNHGLIRIQDICYFETEKRKVKIVTEEKNIMRKKI